MDKPYGGTELMYAWLHSAISPDLLSKFQVISRPEQLDPQRIPVLWIHDMPADVPFITNPAVRRSFKKIVFVSAWQQTVFNLNAGVKFSETQVLKNAIDPIIDTTKLDDGKVHLVYHPTPHRGLDILVSVFDELCDEFKNLELDVFSSFDIYARPEANKQFEPLYEFCRQHPQINYHGSISNDNVRSAVGKAHIFAYPSTWRETSCLTAMEAMSARCLVVAPWYGALSETLANYGFGYSWTEDKVEHGRRFKDRLREAIIAIQNRSMDTHLDSQKSYADTFYSRDTRAKEWEQFLLDLVSEIKPIKKGGFTWMPR